MTPESKQLVKDSWEKVEPISEVAAALFYGRLFELDPELRHLFRGDMEEQGRKLMQTLTVVVRGLDRLDALLPAVETLGRRHAGYGVQDAHYETVAQALLWALERGLGDGFTPAVAQAWAEAYDILATVMKRAAAGASGMTIGPAAGMPSRALAAD
ncbi:MAG TPA: globin family protein [Longimicrobium sp.]|nr:globin family protein [Longimicrobium sp.]